MTKSNQTYIKEACEDIDDVSFRESYSGRAMYGRTCIGIVGSMRDCMKVVLTAASNKHFDLMSDTEAELEYETIPDHAWSLDLDDLHNVCTDSMGLDIIMYWPDLEYVPEEEDGEEDGEED